MIWSPMSRSSLREFSVSCTATNCRSLAICVGEKRNDALSKVNEWKKWIVFTSDKFVINIGLTPHISSAFSEVNRARLTSPCLITTSFEPDSSCTKNIVYENWNEIQISTLYLQIIELVQEKFKINQLISRHPFRELRINLTFQSCLRFEVVQRFIIISCIPFSKADNAWFRYFNNAGCIEKRLIPDNISFSVTQ